MKAAEDLHYKENHIKRKLVFYKPAFFVFAKNINNKNMATDYED